MTHLDLFSGIGGFSLAAHWAGIETIGFSEIDPYASKVLAKHWPNVPNYGDCRNIDRTTLASPDLLTGGPPCSPASCAGARRGEEDIRWLWPEALRILRELRPRWAVFENPPGILSLHGGYAFERILGEIHAAGYDGCWETIPACSVGADHERERVFIISHPIKFGDETRTGETRMQTSMVNDVDPKNREHDAHASSNGLRPGTTRRPNSKSAGQREERSALVESDRPCTIETDFGLLREVHGISQKLDRRERIKALGNSVVPQVAYVILSAIKAQFNA
jgi:DNA (cytosine-5)-methyltransferase 1